MTRRSIWSIPRNWTHQPTTMSVLIRKETLRQRSSFARSRFDLTDFDRCNFSCINHRRLVIYRLFRGRWESPYTEFVRRIFHTCGSSLRVVWIRVRRTIKQWNSQGIQSVPDIAIVEDDNFCENEIKIQPGVSLWLILYSILAVLREWVYTNNTW